MTSKIRVDPEQKSRLEKQLNHAGRIGDAQRSRIRERKHNYIFCKDCGSVDIAITDDIESYLAREAKCPECGSKQMEMEGGTP